MKLSVIVPVYNERNTVLEILSVIEAVPVSKEIIVVDDGSKDGTREILARAAADHPTWRVVYHERNLGKGAAVRTGIAHARGNAVIIQDADLEYDPADYPKLLGPFVEGRAKVVYGSRFLEKRRVTTAWHRFVNYFLTAATNVLYSSNLTDMETCYKLFAADVLRGLSLQSPGFEIEVELTAKTLRSGQKILEVPVSYKGRSFHEGKKIGWKDGFKALAALIRYRLG